MKFFNRKFLFFMLFIGIAAAIGACGKAGTTLSLNADSSGNALRGYDAVAYFAVENAVKGDAKYAYAWNGAKWLFSNEENMKRFQQNPEAYAPQYGGYCSFAVSEGYTADGDPEAWKVVDGKLYLNYSPNVKEMWEKNEAERIDKGTKNWQEFKSKKPEHKG
ncbi:MAG: YHS domain-containing (seleno)protein [Blastocatellia bacterium]